MNWKRSTYFRYATLRGYRFPHLFSDLSRSFSVASVQDRNENLAHMLFHCRASVPFYAEKLKDIPRRLLEEHPQECLRSLPVLTKEMVRRNFEGLKSSDLPSRKWIYNTSGGSTGEPLRLIQDKDYSDRTMAITLLNFSILGYEVGQPLIRLWGSERDIEGRTSTHRARFFNWLTNTRYLNAFRMSPAKMREFLETFNSLRPRLIVAYAQAIYELANFAERQGIKVAPQRSIATSAGTLYPFMREKIARVFGCEVYNMYGSREVSNIACEIPGGVGLWLAPSGNYVEVVDDHGQPVPPGTDGNLLITCLANYAMPLIRYQIGDRGSLLPEKPTAVGMPPGQVLKNVLGRNVDAFRMRDGTLVDGEYFTHLLYFRPWVWKFQVIQKEHECVLFKIMPSGAQPPRDELTEIQRKTQLALGPDCTVEFEFVKDLPPHPSGKYRYTISEVVA